MYSGGDLQCYVQQVLNAKRRLPSSTSTQLFAPNLPNRYSALCWRPVTHAQTWASYSALYRFRRLSLFPFLTTTALNIRKIKHELKSRVQTVGLSCDRQVAVSLSVGALLHHNHGQVVNTLVPLLPDTLVPSKIGHLVQILESIIPVVSSLPAWDHKMEMSATLVCCTDARLRCRLRLT